MHLTDPRIRKLFALLYLAGFLILADQVIEVVAALLSGSPAPSVATWRFGAFGVVTGRISALLVADAFFFAAAIGLEQRLTLRGLAWLHVLLTLVGVLALFLFALDAIEVRARSRGGLAGPIGWAALRAVAMIALTTGLLAWAAIAGLRASRKQKRKGHSRQSPPLVQSAQPLIPPGSRE